MSEPLVTLVIPHYAGDILLDCLETLFERTRTGMRVIVVDDYPGHESIRRAAARFPGIEILRNDRNLGFAAACNRGLAVARSRYVMLLNNDVEVTEGWLEALVDFMETHPEAAACQPKILSFRDRGRFDYSGGAGGMMDRLGYPFCLGRIFDVLEEDRGQYDAPRPIFWASGTAILIRREMLDRTGLLDEGLWAHWEEIDLCWRLQLAGGGIYSVPASVIHHHSGWTLGSDRFLKLYLNHRNSLIVLIKHTGPFRLLWLLPQRAALEALTVAYGLLRLDWKRPAAVLCAFFWLGSHPGALWRGRRASRLLQRIPRREVEGRMYRRALVFQHFLRGVRSAGQLAPPAGAPTQKPAPAAGMP